jgi:hypothetical protein
MPSPMKAHLAMTFPPEKACAPDSLKSGGPLDAAPS